MAPSRRGFATLICVLFAGLAAHCDGTVVLSPRDAGRDARADSGGDARTDARTDVPSDSPPAVCDAACPAHASCADVLGRAQCVCDAGFHIGSGGCVPDATDPCAGVTCAGHGTCIATAGAPTCNCNAGFHAMGTSCVSNMGDPCTGITCSGHGTCSAVGSAPVCLCSAGYHSNGADCLMNAADPCAGVTCSGHGSCMAAGSIATCRCVAGYHSTGLACEADVSADPCAGVGCSGHGTCAVVGGAAVCTCAAGYRVSGLSCIPTGGPDPCASVTCSSHGHCLSDRGTATCHCDTGFVHDIGTPLACVPVAGTVCAGVSCGVGGTCTVTINALGRMPSCTCDPTYAQYALACVVERRLFCRDAGDMIVPRGTTRCGADDSAIESCYDFDGDGLVEWGVGGHCNAGTQCSTGCRTADCTVQPCPLGSTCLAETHMIHVGICVPSCDCNNCTNCTLAAFSMSHALQASCNNPAGPPALGACRMPCPGPGDGCIPYGTGADPMHPDVGNLCYGNEGCFSGPPL